MEGYPQVINQSLLINPGLTFLTRFFYEKHVALLESAIFSKRVSSTRFLLVKTSCFPVKMFP